MTVRNLGTRLDRLEAQVPADRGECIDLSTLTDEELDVLERAPRLANGDIAYDEMSDADLRVIAALAGPLTC